MGHSLNAAFVPATSHFPVTSGPSWKDLIRNDTPRGLPSHGNIALKMADSSANMTQLISPAHFQVRGLQRHSRVSSPFIAPTRERQFIKASFTANAANELAGLHLQIRQPSSWQIGHTKLTLGSRGNVQKRPLRRTQYRVSEEIIPRDTGSERRSEL